MLAVSVTALLGLCALLLLVPHFISLLTGRAAAAAVVPPDVLPSSASEDPTPFLIERNVVQITVPERMTVRELLELYRLNKPDQTRQVFEQLPRSSTPATVLQPGTRLKIALTPIAKDIPGASTPWEGVR